MNENIRDMLMSNSEEDIRLCVVLVGEDKIPFDKEEIRWLFCNTYLQDERWETFWNGLNVNYKEKYLSLQNHINDLNTKNDSLHGAYTFKQGVINHARKQ